MLFGDGAGAAILSKSDDLGLMSSFCKSEGSKYKCITIEGNDVDSPFVENKTGLMSSFCKSEGSKYKCITIEGNDVDSPFVENKTIRHSKLKMDGGEVFKFATSVIVSSINKILKENNLDINDIDYIIPHQANVRIIQYAAKKLKVDMDKFYMNMEEYGNTSGASIPIALSDMDEKGLLKKDSKIY